MTSRSVAPLAITEVVPLTEERWSDLVDLFGERGACEGCWCMYWRTTRADHRPGTGNRQVLRDLLAAGEPIGLIAYAEPAARPVGWCAVAPREAYRRLARSPVGRGGIDEPDRWAVPCFYVRPGYRRRGLTDPLLAAACAHARTQGARTLEGYPTTSPKAGSYDLYVGTRSLFLRHGFRVVRTPTPTRVVVERSLS